MYAAAVGPDRFTEQKLEPANREEMSFSPSDSPSEWRTGWCSLGNHPVTTKLSRHF